MKNFIKEWLLIRTTKDVLCALIVLVVCLFARSIQAEPVDLCKGRKTEYGYSLVSNCECFEQLRYQLQAAVLEGDDDLEEKILIKMQPIKGCVGGEK